MCFFHFYSVWYFILYRDPDFFCFRLPRGIRRGGCRIYKIWHVFYCADNIFSCDHHHFRHKTKQDTVENRMGDCLILGSLFCIWSIKSFILDIPYLFDYEEVYLSQLKFDFDSNYEYSIFYNVEGYDKNRKFYSFTLNKNTYDLGKEQCDQNRNIRAFIEYLPHTNTVMHIEFR